MTDLFAHDAHLLEQEAQVFELTRAPFAFAHKLAQAQRDVLRDLKGHGYLHEPEHRFFDARAKARTVIEVTADAQGACTLTPDHLFMQSHYLTASGKVCEGALIFAPENPVTIDPGDTASVTLIAKDFGEPYNVPAGYLDRLTATVPFLDDFEHLEPASGGEDHQLTRAITLKALEYIYFDAMRLADDAHAAKRQAYRAYYKDEIKRLIASGLAVDINQDGQVSEDEQELEGHGFHRLTRS